MTASELTLFLNYAAGLCGFMAIVNLARLKTFPGAKLMAVAFGCMAVAILLYGQKAPNWAVGIFGAGTLLALIFNFQRQAEAAQRK